MRVLVVDDERDLASAIARGLRRDGIAVDEAYDGDAALEKALLTEYDVIVLDRNLPRMHGDEVCRSLREAGAAARVLMLTAAVEVADHRQVLALLTGLEVELALAYGGGMVPGVDVLAAAAQDLRVLLPTGHPLADRWRIAVADLAGVALALPDRRFGSRALLDEAAAAAGVVLEVAAESNSFETLRGLVREAGLASLQIAIGTPADGAGLVSRPLDLATAAAGTELRLCRLGDRPLSVAAAAFADTLAEALGA